jgi:hypothetical protein
MGLKANELNEKMLSQKEIVSYLLRENVMTLGFYFEYYRTFPKLDVLLTENIAFQKRKVVPVIYHYSIKKVRRISGGKAPHILILGTLWR